MRRATRTKIAAAILLTPVFIILLTAALLYFPPFQQWAVDRVCAYISEETGMDVGIGSVHLSFPLDLQLEDVLYTQRNDSLPQVTDTIAKVDKAVAGMELLPLLDGDLNVCALELTGVTMNTADLVHQCRVKGFVGRLMIDASTNPHTNGNIVASVALSQSVAKVNSVILDNAHLNIELSDTVPEDTTRSEVPWKIYIQDLAISNSSLVLHMPGDTLQISATLKDVKAKDGYIDLLKRWYDVRQLSIAKSGFAFDNNFEPLGRLRNQRGLDVNHISLSNINLRIDSIHYWGPDTLSGRKSEMSALIRQAAMKEQSGITLKSLRAAVRIDSTMMKLDGSLSTPASMLTLNLKMKPNAIDTLDLSHGRIDARIDGSIGREDLMFALCTSLADMSEALRQSWPLYPLTIKGEMHGNLSEVSLPWLTVSLPTAFSLDAKGYARGFMALAKNIYSNAFSAKLHGDLKTYNMAFVKALLDKSTRKTIDLPSMHAIADLTASGPEYDISMKAIQGRGNMSAKAHVNIASMNYTANANVRGLNLGNFVKGYGLSSFTGSLNASGHGTDILAKSTKVKANAAVQQFHYGQYDLSNMQAGVALHNGTMDATLNAHNKLLDGQFSVSGVLSKKLTDVTLIADMNKADLYHLKISKTPLTLALCGHLDVATNLRDYYKVQGMVSDIAITDTGYTFHPDDIIVDLLTRRDTTKAKIDCGDFAMQLNAQGGYRWLLGCTDRLQKVLTRHFHERTIDQDDIRKALPLMTLSLKSGQANPIYQIVKYFDVDYTLFDLSMKTSRENGIFADLTLNGLSTQGYKLDTLTAYVKSTNDPKEIFYKVKMQNRPPNEYVFEARLDGKVMPHGIMTGLRLYDKNNEMALMLGAEATMEESGIRLRLTPTQPVLGYEKFTLNSDNYVMLAHNNRVHAKIDLMASQGTGIKIYCSDNDNADIDARSSAADLADKELSADASDSIYSDTFLQDLTLSINNLNLGKITASLPYAPNIKGILNGDFHMMQNEDTSFALSTDMTVNNMTYEGCTVGNLGTQFTYIPKNDNSHFLDGILTLDDKEVASINGSYNMSTKVIDATMKFEQFPMKTANGFVPEQLLGLEGTAEGNLSVKGTTDKPIVNGELYLQDAALLSVPYGVRLRFDNDPVTITNSKLLLENFQMYAPNDEPLVTYGFVDFSDLDNMKLDIRMKATNFLLINAKENVRSEAYGKVYVNCMAMLQGELNKLQMKGKLEVLPATNLYYILKDSPITTDNTLKELVTFTDLSNSSAITVTRPPVEGLNMDMNVVVDEGAHIKCWLDGSHSNYIDIIGNGDLRLTYRNEDILMTGRYTISQGEMKYSLPVIPLKTFTIEDGSYVEWMGDIMNPHLNITAKETMKASVNVKGSDQMVTFNTGVKLSKTLNDIGLEFIIEAPDDKDIADQLAIRSPEERGKLAVTMLTTGMYLADGNTSSFSMNSALNSFLQSQINTIAGNALKTIDLSFGMESSTENGTLHNDYTFKFAKRFWNNRLSISVGGKISSGPDVSGQNKSFFNNVELQYRLTEKSNKYLQLFYKRDVYDYLEGHLSQYGGGFLWKKKAQTIRDIFRNGDTTAQPASKPVEKKDTLIKFVTPVNEKK